MLNGITWAEGIIILVVGLLIYYSLLFIAAIKAKIKRNQQDLSTGGSVRKRVWQVEEKEEPMQPGNIIPERESEEEEEPELEEWESTGDDKADEMLFDNLETLASDIEDLFANGELLSNREKLLDSLRQKLAGYPMLNGAAFRNALANLITRKAAENDIQITRQETLALWPD